MGLASLYLSRAPLYFGGEDVEPEKAEAILVGVPFDYTSTYRPGSRFAPRAIREAAANIEFFSLRSNIDLDAESVYISDLGDVAVSSRVDETLRRIETVISELATTWPSKLLVMLGGEHTVTLGAIRGLIRANLKPCIIVFDAHLDLRNEYLGEKYSHASVLRRVSELLGPSIAYIGARALTREELEYAKSAGLPIITSREVRFLGVSEVARRVVSWLRSLSCNYIYLSLDMDVIDPAYAPGVGNPEPEGLEPWLLLDIIYKIFTLYNKPPGMVDVVEVSPPHDCSGITSVLAAKIVVELTALHKLLSKYKS
jgi:agmatinase